MSLCEQCGAEQEHGDVFCSRCGSPFPAAIERSNAAPPPPAPPPPPAGVVAPPPNFGGHAFGDTGSGQGHPGGASVPPWLASDWLLAVAGAAAVLAGWFLCSALYGAITAALVALDIGAAAPGALAGLYLPFIGVGATAFVSSSIGSVELYLSGSYLPIAFLVIMLILPWKVLDFASTRILPLQGAPLAFAVKLALIVGVGFGIVAGIISFDGGAPDTNLVAQVSSSSAGMLAFFFLTITGIIHACRRNKIALPARAWEILRSSKASALSDGLVAFLLIALEGAALSLVGALIVADSTEARIAAVLTVPLTAGNVGAAFASFSSGASVTVLDSHLSLFHFGLPPMEDSGPALIPVFAVIALGPALVCWRVLQRLGRLRPRDDRTVMSIGFLAGLGYALALWLAALFLGVRATASVATVDAESFEFDGAFFALLAEPSVPASFGLALLLGVAGGLGGAFYWSQANGVRWFAAMNEIQGPASAWTQRPAPPPPPPPSSYPPPPAPPSSYPSPRPPPPAYPAPPPPPRRSGNEQR